MVLCSVMVSTSLLRQQWCADEHSPVASVRTCCSGTPQGVYTGGFPLHAKPVLFSTKGMQSTCSTVQLCTRHAQHAKRPHVSCCIASMAWYSLSTSSKYHFGMIWDDSQLRGALRLCRVLTWRKTAPFLTWTNSGSMSPTLCCMISTTLKTFQQTSTILLIV